MEKVAQKVANKLFLLKTPRKRIKEKTKFVHFVGTFIMHKGRKN